MDGIENVLIELITQAPIVAVMYLMWRREATRSDRLESRLIERSDRQDEQSRELTQLMARKFENHSRQD